MLVHAVYFWLRADLPDSDRAHYASWLPKLCALPGVRAGYFGVPADTDRPVIDRSYSYGMVLVFDDVAAEQAYQVDPEHDRFRAECSSFWTQVKVFDTVGQ